MPDITSSIKFEEEFIQTTRGPKLYTCRWLPVDNRSIKGLVFLCHGYGMECSVFTKGSGENLAKAGYAVYGIDYEGHGKSDGLRCYIPKFDNLVDDCVTFFNSVKGRPENKNKAAFLYGESLGGCIALLISRREPGAWNGCVLVAPMCKISEKVKPPAIVLNVLTALSPWIGTWKIVPSKNVIDEAFKIPEKREQIRANPYAYQEKPRVKTAVEMLAASQKLESHLHEIVVPFLVLHGDADTVTDPEVSKALYDQAQSSDKTFKLYPGLWHGLLCGESDEDINMVFNDIISWLDERRLKEVKKEIASREMQNIIAPL